MKKNYEYKRFELRKEINIFGFKIRITRDREGWKKTNKPKEQVKETPAPMEPTI